MKKLDKTELSLLLYLETRAVDHSGRVQTKHMNTEDLHIAEMWNHEGFVRFGRIAWEDTTDGETHWCELSDEAWKVVNNERKARAKRGLEDRPFKTAEEKRAVA